jgi:anaerobic selenocysteine-containing dehydrogenase
MAIVLGMLFHIIQNQLYDTAFVNRWVLGFSQLSDHLVNKGYTPEWAESVTTVPAVKIRQIATDYAQAKPAAIFCNAGISHQMSAFQTYRALAFLAAITGNIGVNGGGCNFMHNTWPGGLNLPPLQGPPLPDAGPALPVGPDYFAESILTGNPYRLRAIVTEGNPLLACANTERVREAFRSLEFYVYTGLFMEEAAYYADIILPVCTGLEMATVYMRRDDRGIRWQDQAATPIGSSKPDWQIWIELAQVMANLDRSHRAEYWTQNLKTDWIDYKTLWQVFVENTPGMGGMTQARLAARTEPLRWPCPTTDHPGVSTLYLDHPSWYAAVAALNPSNPGQRFLTPSGKVEIYTPQIDGALAPAGHGALPVFYTHPEVTGQNPIATFSNVFVPNPVNPGALTLQVSIGALSSGAVHASYPLMGMIGRPSVVHFASVTHWTYTGELLNGIRLIQIHPSLASQMGIQDGDPVTVESPRGSITGTATLWSGIRMDTIYVPNTFGPNQIVANTLGEPLYDAANTLLDDRYYDNLSGQQAFKCFACRIRKSG